VIIKILDLAERDLIEGFRFYEAQEIGLGSYFLTTSTPTSNLSGSMLAFMKSLSKLIIACFLVDSLLPFSILLRKTSCQSMLS